MTARDLGTTFPAIDWRKPLPITWGGDKGLACRICIANEGLKGTDVKNLPQTIEEFDEHMRKEHPLE